MPRARNLTSRLARALAVALAVSPAFALSLAFPEGRAGSAPARSPRVVTVPASPGTFPVAYGDAQIDVPSSWSLVADDAQACGSSTGVILLGQGQWCPPSLHQPARPGTTIVALRPLPAPALHLPGGSVRGSSAPGDLAFTAHGIPVYAPGLSPVFVVPTLGIEISVTGPVPTTVLHSLSYSPRAVVLGPSRAIRPPGSWRWISAAGLHLVVPASWPVQRTEHAAGCSSDVALSIPGVVLASLPPLPVSCPLPLSDIQPVPQVAGVEVDGFVAGPASTCVGPRTINGLRVCIRSLPAFGVLLLVAHPRHGTPVMVKLGLFGRGTVDQTILFSLS